jgi:hypothetical protein
VFVYSYFVKNSPVGSWETNPYVFLGGILSHASTYDLGTICQFDGLIYRQAAYFVEFVLQVRPFSHGSMVGRQRKIWFGESYSVFLNRYREDKNSISNF